MTTLHTAREHASLSIVRLPGFYECMREERDRGDRPMGVLLWEGSGLERDQLHTACHHTKQVRNATLSELEGLQVLMLNARPS